MRILIVGCSVTCGMPENNWVNWTHTFTKLSRHVVINMAVGGANMQFLSYLLTKGKEQFNPDYIIVQKTFPNRLTIVKDNFDIKDHIIKTPDNSYTHYCVDPALRTSGEVLTITPSNADKMSKTLASKVEFAKWYFKNINLDYTNVEYNVYESWLDTNSNFSFGPEWLREYIGNDEYKLDSFGHLNAKGSKVMGERIYNAIKNDLH